MQAPPSQYSRALSVVGKKICPERLLRADTTIPDIAETIQEDALMNQRAYPATRVTVHMALQGDLA